MFRGYLSFRISTAERQERFYNDFPPLPEEALYSFATGPLGDNKKL